MMSILTLATIVRSLPVSQDRRLVRWFAAAMVVAGFTSAIAGATVDGASPPAVTAAPTDLADLTDLIETTRIASNEAALVESTESDASATSSDGQGQVFCNGIRLQDEIALLNVRNVCGCCDPAVLRERIIVENYSLCNETGERS